MQKKKNVALHRPWTGHLYEIRNKNTEHCLNWEHTCPWMTQSFHLTAYVHKWMTMKAPQILILELQINAFLWVGEITNIESAK